MIIAIFYIILQIYLNENLDLSKIHNVWFSSPEKEKNASGASYSVSSPPCTRAELVNLVDKDNDDDDADDDDDDDGVYL